VLWLLAIKALCSWFNRFENTFYMGTRDVLKVLIYLYNGFHKIKAACFEGIAVENGCYFMRFAVR